MILTKKEKRAELDNRINNARLMGIHKSISLKGFKDYLLILGLNRYEKYILPLETDEKYPQEQPCTGRKIIPFPGVSLSDMDSFQDGLDNFLHEMGYIK